MLNYMIVVSATDQFLLQGFFSIFTQVFGIQHPFLSVTFCNVAERKDIILNGRSELKDPHSMRCLLELAANRFVGQPIV